MCICMLDRIIILHQRFNTETQKPKQRKQDDASLGYKLFSVVSRINQFSLFKCKKIHIITSCTYLYPMNL